MIYNENKLPFPWYISEGGANPVTKPYKRQARWKMNATNECWYKLYTPNNALLPFQVFIPAAYANTNTLTLTSWFIYRCDVPANGDGAVEGSTQFNVLTNFTGGSNPPISNILQMRQASGVGVWWIYYGGDIRRTLPGGFYYSVMKFGDNSTAVSELFFVVCDNDELGKMTKFEWFNDCDINTIIYQTGYKNNLYLTGDLVKNEPTVEEEGFLNGRGDFIQTMATYFDNYQIEEPINEKTYNALLLMISHKNLAVTLPNSTYTGTLRVTKPQIDWDENGYIGIGTFQFQQVVDIISSACCVNQTFSALQAPVANPDTYYIAGNWTGTRQYYVNVMSNDTGSSISIFYQGQITLNTTYKYTVFDGIAGSPAGSIQIVKSGLAFSNPTFTGTYKIKDSFATQATSTFTIMYGNTQGVDDYISIGAIYVGRPPVNITNSVLKNDILVIPPNTAIPSGGYNGYAVDTTGVILSLEGDGNYIVMNADGTFTYHVVSAVPSALNRFGYNIRSLFTGTIVGSAVIYLDGSI